MTILSFSKNNWLKIQWDLDLAKLMTLGDIQVLPSYNPVPGFKGGTVRYTAVTNIEKIWHGFGHYSSCTFYPIYIYISPNSQVKIDRSRKTVKRDRSKYIPIGPIWSTMNHKKFPIGSGITRSPGLVFICFVVCLITKRMTYCSILWPGDPTLGDVRDGWAVHLNTWSLYSVKYQDSCQ